MPNFAISVGEEPDLGDRKMPSLVPTCEYFGGFSYPPRSGLVHTYMRGECAYFALALQRFFKYELRHVGEHFIALDLDGNYWDIRGCMTPDEALDGIGPCDFTPIDSDGIKGLLENNVFSDGPFLGSRFRKALTLVRSLRRDAPQPQLR